jgi:hypothetical protein
MLTSFRAAFLVSGVRFQVKKLQKANMGLCWLNSLFDQTVSFGGQRLG